jgi:muramoyltetrapeptide carboxypeptidase LdcA involved in peptidoglycan recycling
VLAGGVLLVESSEELIPAREFGWILRSLGERGMLAAVDAVLVARPPASNLDRPRPSLDDRAAHRAAQRDVAVETIARYNPQAVVCVGIPFGHTRPQWILPYAARSPWTARATRCGPTIAELAPRSRHSTSAARRRLRHGLPGRKRTL